MVLAFASVVKFYLKLLLFCFPYGIIYKIHQFITDLTVRLDTPMHYFLQVHCGLGSVTIFIICG